MLNPAPPPRAATPPRAAALPPAAALRSDRRSRHFAFLLALVVVTSCTSVDNGLVQPGVTVTDVTLPVAGGAYRGALAHVFSGGQMTLFCGSHGGFSNSVLPPRAIGETALSEYTATFHGELVLRPPLVASTVTHTLSVQASMAESITLTESNNGVLTFDTELVTFALDGTQMPDGIRVRESPTLASSGVTTVTPVSGGQSRVETVYQVWLEISLDEGRSWESAEQAVRMTLEPS